MGVPTRGHPEDRALPRRGEDRLQRGGDGRGRHRDRPLEGSEGEDRRHTPGKGRSQEDSGGTGPPRAVGGGQGISVRVGRS